MDAEIQPSARQPSPPWSIASFDMQKANAAGSVALQYLERYSPDDVKATAETYTEAQMLDARRVQIYDDELPRALADRAAAVCPQGL